jgi:hypothetical protein
VNYNKRLLVNYTIPWVSEALLNSFVAPLYYQTH